MKFFFSPFWLNAAVCSLFFVCQPMEASARVPLFSDLGVDPAEMARFAGDRQIAVLHKPRPFVVEKEKKDVRFSTSMAVVKAPAAAIERVVLDFEKYPEFVPQAKKVKVRAKTRDEVAIDYSLEFELPVMNINVNYMLHYKRQPDRSIVWSLVKGDIAGSAGRWTFIPLGKDSTLVVYTAWSDLGSMGFTMRTILSAQPDMHLALPIVNTAIVLDAIRRRAEGRSAENKPPASLVKTIPDVPLTSVSMSPAIKKTLHSLTRSGTVLIIHPRQWIQTSTGPLDLVFVGAVIHVDSPVAETRFYAKQFNRYKEFFDQIREAEITETKHGLLVNWQLGLGFGILSVGLDYTLAYTEGTSPNILTFRTDHGDIEHTYGAWEWMPLGENESLAIYTTVSELGPDAPTILKLGDLLPNRKITVGVSTAGVIAEKIEPWIENQPALVEKE